MIMTWMKMTLVIIKGSGKSKAIQLGVVLVDNYDKFVNDCEFDNGGLIFSFFRKKKG